MTSSGDTGIAVSSLPQSAEMPKGCLFPDLIPNRDVSQRYLAQLTREGSYKIGGFHYFLPKDRITGVTITLCMSTISMYGLL